MLAIVKLDHAAAFRVGDLVARYRSTLGARSRHLKQVAKTLAIIDVVAQYQTNAVVTDKVFTYGEGLFQSIPAWQHGLGEIDAPLTTVIQQAFKAFLIFRCDNYHYRTFPSGAP